MNFPPNFSRAFRFVKNVNKPAKVVKQNSALEENDFEFMQVEFHAEEMDCDLGDALCKSDPITTTIQLIDIDDNDPIIHPNNDTETLTIKENGNLDELVGLYVTDKDSQLDLATFEMSIKSELSEAEDQIQLFQTTGYQRADVIFKLISGSTVFDYDILDRNSVEFELWVQGSKKNVSKKFVVNLEDVNDNPPEFTEAEYKISFEEDLSDLELVNGTYKLPLSLETSDNDRSDAFGNKSLIYELLSSRFDLIIDDKSGDIFIDPSNNPFDYELEAEPEITVVVKDNNAQDGYLSSSTIVSIKLIDVNDEKPNLDLTSGPFCIKENSTSMESNCNQTDLPNLEELLISGTDPDTNANLVFDIDWNNTRAT